ncbi:cholesterol oxidase substrate-binding domain-containing protein [Actinophytocola sediminis]
MGMFEPEQGERVWDEAGYDATDWALFAALTHPTADAMELDNVTEWHVWGWYLDDYFVRFFKWRRDLPGARAFVDRLLSFAPPHPAPTPTPQNGVERGLGDLWARSGELLPPAERQQFWRGLSSMVRSTLWELANLVHNRHPDPIDYLEMRRETGGGHFAINTSQIGVGVSIPPQILRSRAMRALSDAFSDVLVFSNDMFSYDREVEVEDHLNSHVVVARRFLGYDLQRAVGMVNDVLTTRVKEMEKVVDDDLPRLLDHTGADTATRANVLEYCQGLQRWAAGIYQWSIGNPRYADPALWPRPRNAMTVATDRPPHFPEGIAVSRQEFRNWVGELRVNGAWTAAPASADEVVTLVNWAHTNGWRVRAKGRAHSWAPLIVQPTEADKVLLVDLTEHLNAVSINPGTPASVTAQSGVILEDLTAELEAAGYRLTGYPEVGDVSLGGILAVDAHGSAVAPPDETPAPGESFGTVSNSVLELTAVVWDRGTDRYVLRTFRRSDPEAAALTVNLGRSLIVETTLQVAADHRIRCQSFDTIPASTLFAHPESAGESSFAALLGKTWHASLYWFPFVAAPWLRVFSVEPDKPATSREVTTPYNYPFADSMSETASSLLTQVLAGKPALTPAFQAVQAAHVSAGLTASGARDVWGWSKNILLTGRPSTLRVTAGSWAIITSRANIQRAVHELTSYLSSTLQAYARRGEYPINQALVLRFSGTDDPAEVGHPGARSPQLSAARHRSDQPEFDIIMWLDVLTTPGVSGTHRFYHQLEQWLVSNYASYAGIRPEWSKGWAFTDTSAWSDPTILDEIIPAAYRYRQPADDNWDTAVETLNALDPHGVLTSPLLDRLFGTTRPVPVSHGHTGLGTNSIRSVLDNARLATARG